MTSEDKSRLVYPIVRIMEGQPFIDELNALTPEDRASIAARIHKVLEPGVPLVLSPETSIPAVLGAEEPIQSKTHRDITMAEMTNKQRSVFPSYLKSRLDSSSGFTRQKVENEIDSTFREGGIQHAYNAHRPDRNIAYNFRRGKMVVLDDKNHKAFLWAPVRELADMYAAHIAEFGSQSIAHLCLDKRKMQHLTHGIKVNGQEMQVNTIDELRSLISGYLGREYVEMEELPGSPGHDPLKHFKRIASQRFLGDLNVKLAVWDALPDAA